MGYAALMQWVLVAVYTGRAVGVQGSAWFGDDRVARECMAEVSTTSNNCSRRCSRFATWWHAPVG